MPDKIIRINWDAPLPFDEAIESEQSNTQGLYYITRLFGQTETSLYLGIATKGNTIRHRLRAHAGNWLSNYRGEKYVRIGYVVYPRNFDEEILYNAESAILYAPEHKNIFPRNIGKRKSYSYDELYRVENTGNCFELEPVIRMHDQ